MEEIKNITNPPPTVAPLTGQSEPASKNFAVLAIVGVVVIVLGVLTGWGLSRSNVGMGATITPTIGGKAVETVSSATEEGVKDASAFKDMATGEIKVNDGKLTSEGSHILVRPGGVSQNVYLTSSVIDLEKYIGKTVQVWGQTYESRKAGWLMDVGRIKLVQ